MNFRITIILIHMNKILAVLVLMMITYVQVLEMETYFFGV